MMNEHIEPLNMNPVEMQIIHAFRTQFTAINVSLKTVHSVLPTLIEGYNYAQTQLQLDKKYSQEYLTMVLKSVFNSIEQIKKAESNLNDLQRHLNQANLECNDEENGAFC